MTVSLGYIIFIHDSYPSTGNSYSKSLSVGSPIVSHKSVSNPIL